MKRVCVSVSGVVFNAVELLIRQSFIETSVVPVYYALRGVEVWILYAERSSSVAVPCVDTGTDLMACIFWLCIDGLSFEIAQTLKQPEENQKL